MPRAASIPPSLQSFELRLHQTDNTPRRSPNDINNGGLTKNQITSQWMIYKVFHESISNGHSERLVLHLCLRII